MIYIVILFLIFTFAFLEIYEERYFPKYEKIFFVMFFIFLLLFTGFRFYTGYDFKSYEIIFKKINYKNVFTLDIEKGFTLFCYLLKLFGGTFQILLISIALISLSLKYYTIKNYSIYPFLSLAVYFSANFLIQDFGQIRQGLAVACTLYSIKFIKERKLKQFLFIMIFAISFHYSALIFLPFYWFGNNKLKNKNIVIIIIISIMVMLLVKYGVVEYILRNVLQFKYFLYKYEAYAGKNGVSFFKFTFLFRIFIFILFFVLEDKIRPKCKIYDILKNGYLLSIIMYIMFKQNAGLATRGALYFKMLEIIIIPYIVYALRYKKILFNAILIFYLYTLKDLMGALLGQTDKFIPYKNLLLNLFY